MKTIDCVYLFVAENEATPNAPAEEGVVAYVDHESGALQPLMTTDPKDLNNMRAGAKQIALGMGKKIKLVKFTAREEIGTVGQ